MSVHVYAVFHELMNVQQEIIRGKSVKIDRETGSDEENCVR